MANFQLSQVADFGAEIGGLHESAELGEILSYREYAEDFHMSDKEIKLLYLSSPASREASGTTDIWRINQLLRLDNDKVKIKTGPGGSLKIFPAEIWMEILRKVDIKTLTLLRHVSKGFRNLIDTLPDYKLLYSKAPYLIRAAIITGVGSYLTISQLNLAYRTVRCSFRNCHNDGEYIYFLTARRVCFSHISKIKLCLVDRGRQKFFKDTHPLLRSLPRLTTLIGERQSSYIYVDKASLITLHGKGILPAWIQHGLDTVPGRSSNEVLKTCIRVPWYDPVTGKQDWGYYCNSNLAHSELPPSQFGPFRRNSPPKSARSAETMLRHLDKCEAAQSKWKKFCPEGYNEEKF